MINATISEKNRTITLTKKDYAAAQKYGTDAYRELQQIRRDYPGFRIVKSSKSNGNKETYKGLTYNYMEAYIEKHDNEEKTIMAEFNNLRGKSEVLDDLGMPALSYNEIKEWFLIKFPAIRDFMYAREKIMNATKEAQNNNKSEKIA